MLLTGLVGLGLVTFARFGAFVAFCDRPAGAAMTIVALVLSLAVRLPAPGGTRPERF
ncbi:MAG: hypothetical protein R2752_00830 [Vicinamibacterales bacterium]